MHPFSKQLFSIKLIPADLHMTYKCYQHQKSVFSQALNTADAAGPSSIKFSNWIVYI